MTNSLRPYGNRRTPLPPADAPAAGGAGPHTPSAGSADRSDASGSANSAGKQRDAFFDNAKYLAIVLVGVGHAWGQILDDNPAVEALYRFIYTFHMPAFIIISGYFSRSFDMSPKRVKRLIATVVVPYLVFEVAYTLHKRIVNNDPGADFSLLDATYLLWFLCALFVWRLTTPIWKTIRYPLPVAIVIGALASMTPSIGNDLDMQRVLQFLPCFVLGLMLRPEHFNLVRRRSVRIASLPVMAAALAVAWWSVPRMSTGWFYRDSAAQDAGAPWWTGPVMMLALFGCSLVLTACFLAWIPGRRMWFTSLGAGTIYGFLLHGFVVKTGTYQGWFKAPVLDTPLGEIALTVIGAVGITLMCTRPVRQALRWVVEPRMDWAFRRDAIAEAREREKRSEAAPSREKVSV
ncbi:acyltransferase family protein [Streptomyces sp. SBST2-5]|uniref:Acyltransferase family protein n=1 Tax=Streptomyces composti TaxID=2720025 RepID=A0ABX1AFT8_9ACTN|nr:acyltransferase family protein [Streptomyces composti]NJP53306.1 acyltransferase family protein [Streptomyces composti]